MNVTLKKKKDRKWPRNRRENKNKLDKKSPHLRRMMIMDGYWYEELPTLNRVIWRGAITQMNLPLIYL
jgi:hypothetical protein